MPDSSAQHFLQETLQQQKASIAKYMFNGEKVWIKKAGKHNSIWLYRLVGLGTKILGVDALAPVPSTGGKEAIQTEVKRLKALAEHGINVPKLLAYNDYGLMISDMGNREKSARQLDSTLLRHSTNEETLYYFKKTVDAILDTHKKNMWLSEVFIRNILIDQHNEIGFIDFETDPHDYLNKDHCYARDWIYFMYSVAIRMQKHDLLQATADYLKQAFNQESESTQYALKIACSRLSFLRKLPVQKFGNDGERLLATATLFTLIQ
ncbi:hypothetical protein F4V57_07820 [Acinetobacter qingfengensis]|uniref:Serine/threonine protein kinase n=1 Tax=Acinetobacter qingfengensis TaxID=1262585 RepID=A0A1E7QYV4_9GAMM|nr:hypothetical protein [Acinetobacter qingfengensis]KAA8733129.1 hypothetical protein F4V57_07820 [Acinetobacter qingfengensis]OEY92278.1 hypothetical protein BJI46_05915 [Acinetobacter qingfengensis]